MADPTVSYPFDPTGQAVSNRIPNEQVIILPPGDRLFHFTMLKFGPFFEEGLDLKLRDLNNNVIELTKGVDYYLSHKFMGASLSTMHPVYGSITFLRRDIVGTLIANYNTLGGIWTIDSSKILEILSNTTLNPRITTWEQVVDRPIDFPVIDHEWDLADMVGMKEILAVLTNFYNAYLLSIDPTGGSGSGTSLLSQHINNHSNPHQVTAAQIGTYTGSQIDAKLLQYQLKSQPALDSQKLGGHSYDEIVSGLIGTKVANATHADAATTADTATNATNTTSLGGKTLQALMTDVVNTKVANASHADNATHSDVADLASNALKLGGHSYDDIVALIVPPGTITHAVTADSATRADSATSADQFGGMGSDQFIQFLLSQTVANSTKFFGKTYSEAKADILSGTAANATLFGGQTSNDYFNMVKSAYQSADAAVTADVQTALDSLASYINQLLGLPA